MPKKVQKIKLKLSSEHSFHLFGIVSSENDYTLSWKLNNTLGINLKKTNDKEIPDNKSEKIKQFSKFEYYSETTDISYLLLSNKSEFGFLIPEQKQIDYFFKVEADAGFDIKNIRTKIKKTKGILAVFKIVIDDLKSINNLQ